MEVLLHVSSRNNPAHSVHAPASWWSCPVVWRCSQQCCLWCMEGKKFTSTMRSFSFKQYTQVDLVLAFINLYTQQSKSYFAGYQKYWIMRERQSMCCCETHIIKEKKARGGRGGHAREKLIFHGMGTEKQHGRNSRIQLPWRQETARGCSEKKT